MFPHPILASEDDEEYVRHTVFSMPGIVEKFFTSLERVYLESRNDEAFDANIAYYTIQSRLKVLSTVPPSSYRNSDTGANVKELPDRIDRMRRLFVDGIVVVSPQAIAWKQPVTRLAEEIAEYMRQVRIRFPFFSSLIRRAISYHTVSFSVLISVFIASFIGNAVAFGAVSLVGPPPVVGVTVGAISVLFLGISSFCVLFHFIVAVRALQAIFMHFLEYRMHVGPQLPPLFVPHEKKLQNTTGEERRVKCGLNTKKGYYTIPYGDGVGYIESKHVDTQVVMIGFDEKYLITRWNIASEVMTGFLESGCIGKPLSELVDTPTGDVSRDISALQASRGDVMRVRLRCFATAPAILFTIAAPILDNAEKRIGNILICSNSRDNLREFRSYIRDYFTTEINFSLLNLLERSTLAPEEFTALKSLQSFLSCGMQKQVNELAREMLTEWEWTTADQLLGQMLRSSTLKHERVVDPMFPATLCLHPQVAQTVAAVLGVVGVPCTLEVQVLNPAGKVFCLVVTIRLNVRDSEKHIERECLRDAIISHLRSTCGKVYKDDDVISIHFPCQVTAVLEGVEDSAFEPEKQTEESLIEQSRAIVNCTVNVLTLITNLVDQHNISMVLLKTMFVSLTSVRGRRELEKRLEASPNDVDVIVCDHGWLNSVEELIVAHNHSAIIVPLAESGVPFASKGFQYVISTPISLPEIRRVLMDVGTAVSLKKNAATAQEERERILTLRQDSPWTKGILLGRGSFGVVYEAVSDLTGGKMAVKMFYFPADREEYISKLLNEIKIMCSLNHPNIVHYFHCERKENNVNLFMELCNASLGDIIIGKTTKPRNLTVIKILRQVLVALAYLHARGVAHRDIKPPNILLKNDTIKISDFGTAREGSASKDVQGTLRYMAPEVYMGEAHSSPCDIWSVGCLACELFLCPPKFMENPFLLSDLNSASPYLENITNNVTLNDFLKRCFHCDPEKRPTAADLLLHPLFSSACKAEVESLPNIFVNGVSCNKPAFSLSTLKE